MPAKEAVEMEELEQSSGICAKHCTRTPSGFLLSPHAAEQALKRGLFPHDTDFVLSSGEFRRGRRDRSVFYIPESPFLALKADPQFQRLQGVVVVLAPDGKTIVTIFDRDWRFGHNQDKGSIDE